MWRNPESVQGFKEVLREYKPDRILVVGKDTWRYLPGKAEFPDNPPVLEPGFRLPNTFTEKLPNSERYAYWYPTGRGQFALAAPVFHPGYPEGFVGTQTKAVTRKLLRIDWKIPS